MKVAVKILPKKDVLDTQGRAVKEALERKGYGLQECRVGKYLVLDIEADNEKAALKEAEKMAQQVLHNNLIETFEVEVL